MKIPNKVMAGLILLCFIALCGFMQLDRKEQKDYSEWAIEQNKALTTTRSFGGEGQKSGKKDAEKKEETGETAADETLTAETSPESETAGEETTAPESTAETTAPESTGETAEVSGQTETRREYAETEAARQEEKAAESAAAAVPGDRTVPEAAEQTADVASPAEASAETTAGYIYTGKTKIYHSSK